MDNQLFDNVVGRCGGHPPYRPPWPHDLLEGPTSVPATMCQLQLLTSMASQGTCRRGRRLGMSFAHLFVSCAVASSGRPISTISRLTPIDRISHVFCSIKEDKLLLTRLLLASDGDRLYCKMPACP